MTRTCIARVVCASQCLVRVIPPGVELPARGHVVREEDVDHRLVQRFPVTKVTSRPTPASEGVCVRACGHVLGG